MHNISSTQTFSHEVKNQKAKHDKATDGALGQQVSTAAHEKNELKKTERTTAETIKQQFNTAILQSSLEVSVNAGNESLALVYKAAIEGINDVLEPEMGSNALQNTYDSGLDVSPEATADRIVSLSTAFFSSYQEQHPELSDEQAANKFADIIGGGIDKGFAEARDILEGLKVLEGDIASNIDTTYDLVQQGLKAFVDSFAVIKEEKTE